MTARVWNVIDTLEAGEPDGETAAWWLTRLIGPVHRLAWHGDTDSGHRARCRRLFARMLQAAYAAGGPPRQLAELLDWWSTAVFGEDVLGTAWQLDEPVWLADLLRRLLHGYEPPALRHFRQPFDLGSSVEELRRLLEPERRVRLRVAPAPEIYGEARQEAQRLLKAYEDREPRPPAGLRLIEDDVNAWASEPRGTHRLLEGVKVWFPLVKALTALRDAAQSVCAAWTLDASPVSPLPADWRARLRDHLGALAPPAEAVLADIDVGATDPPPPPECASPKWLAASLCALPDDIDFHVRVRLLALAEEVREAAPQAERPAWAAEALARLEELRRDARALGARAGDRGLDEVIESVDAAAERLDDLDSRQAEEWIGIARHMLEEAADDETVSHLEEEGSGRWADLISAGLADAEGLPTRLTADDPNYLQGLAAWSEGVVAKWTTARERVDERIAEQAARCASMPAGAMRTNAEQAIREAEAAIDERSLTRAIGAVGAAERALAAGEDELEPELASLHARLRRTAGLADTERASVGALLERIATRAAAGLPYAALIETADRLLCEVDTGQLLDEPVLGVVTDQRSPKTGALRIAPVCWLHSAVQIDRDRCPDIYAPVGPHVRPWTTVRLPGIPYETLELTELVTDLGDGFHDVWSATSRDGVALRLDADRPGVGHASETVFTLVAERVRGPAHFAGSDTGLQPADSRGFEASLDSDMFWTLFGRVEVTWEEADRPRALVHDPPDLETMLEVGASVVDHLTPEQREHWIASLLDDFEGVRWDRVVDAMGRLDRERVPAAVLEDRLSWLERLMETSSALAGHRERAAERFLDTDEGRREKARAAARLVEQSRETLEREIDARRATLEAELEVLAARVATMHEGEKAKREALDARLLRAREDVGEAERLRDSALLRVVGAVFAGAQGTASHGPDAPVPARSRAQRLTAAVTPRRPFPGFPALGDELCEQLPHVEPQLVRGLLATVVTSPWLLFAGPPGGGKSTLARDLARCLGAGPECDTYLELVVRREWHDDAALFGFWHPQRRAWEASTDGLVEHLLTAADDDDRGLGGLYVTLLEELNLASPEYYLGRLISALEADTPRVHLYGRTETPPNAERYPSNFGVSANVRFFASVNVDETVERLSPRFLSRASVVWIEPTIATLFGSARIPARSAAPVHWAEVAAGTPAPVELGIGIRSIAELLQRRRVPGAPSARTVRAIARYLAVARTLLPATVASDFAVEQRILPALRGVGERYRSIFDELRTLCDDHGWTRSVATVDRIRQRGEDLGDFYDFFHT